MPHRNKSSPEISPALEELRHLGLAYSEKQNDACGRPQVPRCGFSSFGPLLSPFSLAAFERCITVANGASIAALDLSVFHASSIRCAPLRLRTTYATTGGERSIAALQ